MCSTVDALSMMRCIWERQSVHVKRVNIPERTMSTMCCGSMLEEAELEAEARALRAMRVVKMKTVKTVLHWRKLTKNYW
jgi:hypothetical protein